MRDKESFWDRLLKYFYGVEELDEYRERELNRINSRIFMILWLVVILSCPFLFFIIYQSPRRAAWWLFTSIVVIFIFIIPLVSSLRSYYLQLNRIDVDNKEFQIRYKKTFQRTIITSLYWILIMSIASSFWEWFVIGGNFLSHFCNPYSLFIWIVSGYFVWRFIWIISQTKFKAIDSNEEPNKRRFLLLGELVLWLSSFVIFIVFTNWWHSHQSITTRGLYFTIVSLAISLISIGWWYFSRHRK